MSELGIGLIGSGFMGASHAFALAAVGQVFDLSKKPRLELLADASEVLAQNAARRFGFARATADWRALIADPAVDVVHITAPNRLHVPMAKAAIAAGKAVHCEKPLALNFAEASELADLAEDAGTTTIVGFNYLKNPDPGAGPRPHQRRRNRRNCQLSRHPCRGLYARSRRRL